MSIPVELNRDETVVFGVLTDIQYAEIHDVTKPTRFYRNSANLVHSAVDEWQSTSRALRKPLSFILQLGDIIEGYRVKETSRHETYLRRILDEFERINDNYPNESTRILHVWGNHDLYGFRANKIADSVLNSARALSQEPDSKRNYYFVDVTPRLRLICLDQFEISVIGVDEASEEFRTAAALVAHHKKLRPSLKHDSEKTYSGRFEACNGAIGTAQMEWLEAQLAECVRTGKKVLLVGHMPLLVRSADELVVWNAEDILELVWSCENTVVAYLCGHYHQGGSFIDHKNVRHITLPAIVETEPHKRNSYITGFVDSEKIFLRVNYDPSLDLTVYF